MNRYGRRKLSIVVLVAIWFGIPQGAQAKEPLDLVKAATEKAIRLKIRCSRRRIKKRIERLREIINPIFDYEEMARRTLGQHQRRRTPAEQEVLTRLFRGFLERIYSNKVDFYEGEKVVFGRETIEQDYAKVESTVTNAKGDESPVIYRLKRTDGKWKVYDAVVETISIVNNYRSRFDRVISKSSYDELKKMLKRRRGRVQRPVA